MRRNDIRVFWRGVSLCCFSLALVFTAVEAPAQEKPVAREASFFGDWFKRENLSDTDFPDRVLPFLGEKDIPERVAPLIEIGPGMLEPGPLSPGIELPTGAVWSPSLWIYGDYRTGIDLLDNGKAGSAATTTWSNRIDLFANLQLSGSERILAKIEPVNTGGKFTRCQLSPDRGKRCDHEFNFRIKTLFFEGIVDEIFPNINEWSRLPLDFGFSVGRQSIYFQDGIMLNDTIDAVSLSKQSLEILGSTGMRIAGVFGWSNVNRDDNRRDDDQYLYGLFVEADYFPDMTVEIDLAGVDARNEPAQASGDQINFGAGIIQRIGKWNTSVRYNTSQVRDNQSAGSSSGHLLFAELSTEPRGTGDVFYLTGFAGIDQYASLAANGTVGGPLRRAGILFRKTGLGGFGPALSNRADDVYGGAMGYQMFFDMDRTQLSLEVAGRVSPRNDIVEGAAVGFRFQRKLNRRTLMELGGFYADIDSAADWNAGLRSELRVKF